MVSEEDFVAAIRASVTFSADGCELVLGISDGTTVTRRVGEPP